jgi:DNA-binding LytR/AlgR family response regulator
MIRCLAIDDEYLALELLEDNIRKVPFLELVKSCNSAAEAMEILQGETVDLIFLDIQMPDITGIQMLKSLKTKPLVIFTTAYEKYALQGYELDVIDYLLKPFSFERFLKAVNKAQEYVSLKERSQSHGAEEVRISHDFLFVKADYRLVKVDLKDILYIEGLKDYIKIYVATSEKPVVTLLSLKTIEEKLPQDQFVRVHKSYIVALKNVEFIQKTHLQIRKKEIPVSDHYRDQLYKIINQNKMQE